MRVSLPLRLAVTMLMVLAMVGVVAPASAEPAAGVHIDRVARQGQGNTFTAVLRARCTPGFALQEIVVEFTQGDLSATSVLTSGLTCDGAWHRLRVGSPEGYDPGKVRAFARMTVIDVETGDPAPQAVAERVIWVRAATGLILKKVGWLTKGGNAWVTVFVRCDRPWVESELVVNLTQDGFNADILPPTGTVPCDDRWHRFRLKADAATPFHRGPAELSGSISVLDPFSFDPIASTQISRAIRLKGRLH